LYNGIHLSKQILRDYYKKTPWYAVIEKEKAEGKGKGNYTVPPRLPKELLELVGNMYKSATEAWIGKEIWGAPSIEEVVGQYKHLVEKGKF